MTILHGDCLDLMAEMEPNSVDAIVTDPPYGLTEPRAYKSFRSATEDGRTEEEKAARRGGFMGKKWDGTGIEQDPATWEACLRVLKPGGHLVAFSGTRTSHRMICAIEDAGFEIRDSLSWLYGSGFPKSLDVGKAIDKANGAERDTQRIATRSGNSERRGEGEQGSTFGDAWGGFTTISSPATPEAEQWQGWGTALKPGHEPICLARKPLSAKNIAANVLAYGTGAINVDACRIGTESTLRTCNGVGKSSSFDMAATGEQRVNGSTSGRWPANVILDETAAGLLDAMSGERNSGGPSRNPDKYARGSDHTPGWGNIGVSGAIKGYPDTGGASRFFLVAPIDDPDAEHLRFKYAAKASRAERNAGLDGMPEKQRPGAFDDDAYEWKQPNGHVVAKPSANHHPTVKPISLMRWLVRLVTPPGGVILDPFTGSGSTGCAAALEGFDFIGCEREAEYVEIARARIAHWTPKPEPQLILSLEMTA